MPDSDFVFRVVELQSKLESENVDEAPLCFPNKPESEGVPKEGNIDSACLWGWLGVVAGLTKTITTL